jgi:outer membrane usher protein FimD/PapC
VLLSVYMEDGTPALPGSMATLDGAGDRFPVGLDGEVQLWGAQQGARVVVDTGSGLCEFVLDVELPDEPMPDLGAFTCRRRVP